MCTAIIMTSELRNLLRSDNGIIPIINHLQAQAASEFSQVWTATHCFYKDNHIYGRSGKPVFGGTSAGSVYTLFSLLSPFLHIHRPSKLKFPKLNFIPFYKVLFSLMFATLSLFRYFSNINENKYLASPQNPRFGSKTAIYDV